MLYDINYNISRFYPPFFIFKVLLKYSWLTMWSYLLYDKVIQLYMHTHSFSDSFPILRIIEYGVEFSMLYSRSPLTNHWTYLSVHMPIPNPKFIPFQPVCLFNVFMVSFAIQKLLHFLNILILYLLFCVYVLLKYSWFTMFCQLLLYSIMTQSYILCFLQSKVCGLSIRRSTWQRLSWVFADPSLIFFSIGMFTYFLCHTCGVQMFPG